MRTLYKYKTRDIIFKKAQKTILLKVDVDLRRNFSFTVAVSVFKLLLFLTQGF